MQRSRRCSSSVRGATKTIPGHDEKLKAERSTVISPFCLSKTCFSLKRMLLPGGGRLVWAAACGKPEGTSLPREPAGRDRGESCAGRGLSTWPSSGISKVELSPPPCLPSQQTSILPNLRDFGLRRVRNETYFPMCFLSFLIKISKAYLSVAEGGKLW